MTKNFRRVIALMLSVVMCLTMVHVTTVKSNADSTILEEDMVTLSFQETGYTGEAQNPTVTVVDGETTLVEDEDYTVEFEDNTEIGTYTVTVEGIGNYQGKISKTFEITKGDTALTYNDVASYLLVEETATITANAKTDITFASSDEAVVTVDQDGLITAVGLGTATITITAAETEYYKGATATVDIEVVEEIPTTEEPTTEEPTTETTTGTTTTTGTAGASGTTGTTTSSTTTYTLREGNEFETGGVIYTVSASSDGTLVVILDSVSSKNITSFTVDTVTIYGVTYKITSIGSYAFANCTNLTSVTIGSSVTTIGDHAFYNCTNLKTVSGCSNVTSIGAYAFNNCTNLKTVSGCSNVTSIGAYAFCDCTKLTTIGSKKNKITLSKVKEIGAAAFASCSSIKKVNITSSALTSIGTGAFEMCTKLKSFSASSKKLKKIGAYAFYGDKKLAKVILKTTKLKKKNVGDYAFSDTKSKCTFKVPKSKIKAYKKIFKARGAGSKIKVKKS